MRVIKSSAEFLYFIDVFRRKLNLDSHLTFDSFCDFLLNLQTNHNKFSQNNLYWIKGY